MDIIIERGYRSVLFVALGGGGDVATAAMLARASRRLGVEARIASVAWERYMIDPVPGPIRLEEIQGAKRVGEYSALVNRDTFAIRGGRRIVFQAVNVSRIINEEVGVVDLYRGVLGVRRGIEELRDFFGAEVVIGVDVGGDILATGYEEDLWSPLADFVGLASIKDLESILAVHSPGGDGELSQEYVLSRISLVASRRGFLGARGLTPEDYEFLKRLLEHVSSEASKTSLYAFEGLNKKISMRSGSREAYISIINTLTFLLDPRVVADLNPIVNHLVDTKSIYEARDILRSLGIFTELDLEEEVSKLIASGSEISGEAILEIKRRYRSRRSQLSST